MGQSDFFKKENNPIVKTLKLMIKYESENRLSLKIFDANNTRFEIPDKEPFPENDSGYPSKIYHKDQSGFSVTITRKPFSVTIVRKATKEIIFDTTNSVLIYSHRFIELETKIPTPFLIGMGERNYKSKLEKGVYTLWSRDIYKEVEDGMGGHNTYGVHPVYLMREKTGNFHMVFLRNSNALDFTVSEGSVNYKIVIMKFNYFSFFKN